MDIDKILNGYRKLDNESNELTTRIGIGEDMPTIISNILINKIKPAYIRLINPICEYSVRNKLLDKQLICEFIHEHKNESTAEYIVQPIIDLYNPDEYLPDTFVKSVIDVFGDDADFLNALKLSVPAAIAVHTYTPDGKLGRLRQYQISDNLEIEVYSYAVAVFGYRFIEANYEEMSRYYTNIPKYAKLLTSMLRQGLKYSTDMEILKIVNTLFMPIIKNSDKYLRYIREEQYRKEFESIIQKISNLDSLNRAGFDQERFEFWKEYLSSGKFEIYDKHSILIIKLERRFILEQVSSMGYMYIFDIARYENISKQLNRQDYNLKHELNQLAEHRMSMETRCRHSGLWQERFRGVLNNYGIYTDMSVYHYDSAKEERRKLTPSMRKFILRRDGYTCQYCGKNLRDERFHIDHKLPVSRGGKTVEDNLLLACQRCNLRKHDKTEDEFRSLL